MENVEQQVLVSNKPGKRPIWDSMALWFFWTLGITLAGIVGWAVGAVLQLLTFGVGIPVLGFTAGACLGIAQILALGWYFPKLNSLWPHWIAWTTIGMTIGWIVVIISSLLLVALDRAFLLHPAHPLITFSIGGAIVGFIQWRVLRQSVKKASWWIPMNIIGWSIGAFVGLRAGHAVHEAMIPGYEGGNIFGFVDAIHTFVTGAVTTSVFSLITGIVLLVLARLSMASLTESQENLAVRA